MRKDDWITQLYYKQLNDKPKNNRDSRENVPIKKKNPPKSIKPKCK